MKLGNFKEVRSMVSSNGNEVPNQFIIITDLGTVFQSYKTVIVFETNGKVFLDNKWNYSRTTGKYRNSFLGESKKETEAKIKSGVYTVTNLNE